jgi:hypothetical protein
LQVILHIDSHIVNSGKVILLLNSREAVELIEVVTSRLLLEDLLELFFGILNLIKGGSLVHACLPNSSPASEYHVEIAVGIVEQLHFIENIVAIYAVFEIDLSQIDVPWFLTFIEDLVGDFESASLVYWDPLILLLC